MKIVTQDQGRLVATDKQTGGLVIGFILILVGLGVAAAFLASHDLKASAIGLTLLVFGAVAVLLHKARTISIDKSAGSIMFTVKTVFGTKQHPYQVQDAQKIQLTTEIRVVASGNTGSRREEETQLMLIFKDGSTIDLADGSKNLSSFGIFGKIPNQGVGQQIADFLGIPFESAGPASLGQVVQGVESMIHGNATAPSVVPTAAPATQPVQPAQPTVVQPDQAQNTGSETKQGL